jgi:hypothetical protein
LFLQSYHPVVFTRKFKWFETTLKSSFSQKQVTVPGFPQPSTRWVTATSKFEYTYKANEATPSYNQLVQYVSSVDKNGGKYTDQRANVIATTKSGYTGSFSARSSTSEQWGYQTYAIYQPD